MGREHDAGEPRQRLSGTEIGLILQGMASDAIRHANQLRSLAGMVERYDRSGPTTLGEAVAAVSRDITGEGNERG